MKWSLESRALACALLAASLSIGGALLTGDLIHGLGASPAAPPSMDFTNSPERISQGSNYFAMSCSQCHGDDAHGDEGPDLHNLSISNARIARTIKSGVKGEMPTFAKKYDDQQIASLVIYLRSLH